MGIRTCATRAPCCSSSKLTQRTVACSSTTTFSSTSERSQTVLSWLMRFVILAVIAPATSTSRIRRISPKYDQPLRKLHNFANMMPQKYNIYSCTKLLLIQGVKNYFPQKQLTIYVYIRLSLNFENKIIILFETANILKSNLIKKNCLNYMSKCIYIAVST